MKELKKFLFLICGKRKQNKIIRRKPIIIYVTGYGVATEVLSGFGM
jgi:hypothetical protein